MVRPLSLLSPDKRLLKRMATKNPSLSNEKLAVKLRTRGGPQVSRHTIVRALSKIGFKRKWASPVPFLSQANKNRRLAWCQENLTRNWRDTIFSDESLFQFHPNRARFLAPRGGKRTYPRPFRSPRIMVWGGISFRGRTPLVTIIGQSTPPNTKRYWRRDCSIK